MDKRKIFITGTDTGIGKTFITGMLAKQFYDDGNTVITQKWVQTGCDSVSDDILEHRALSGDILPRQRKMEAFIAPYILSYPASPHLAAKIDNITIDRSKIIEAFHEVSSNFDITLIEGSGGVLVPFNEKEFLIDIVKDINASVILVSDNRLGAINQTLLSVDVLRQRKIDIIGIIFNNIRARNRDIILEDNPSIIEKLSGVPVLGEIGFHKAKNDATADFLKTYQELKKRLI